MRIFLYILTCLALTSCTRDTAEAVQTKVKGKDWRFPTESLVAEKLFLCSRSTGPTKGRVFAARLECKSIKLPDVNWQFERERLEEVHISLGLQFPHADISKLRGVALSRELLRKNDHESSVYLFGQHLDVEVQSVTFGELKRDSIDCEVRLRIDLSYVKKGWIEARLAAPAVIEDRG